MTLSVMDKRLDRSLFVKENGVYKDRGLANPYQANNGTVDCRLGRVFFSQMCIYCVLLFHMIYDYMRRMVSMVMLNGFLSVFHC